MLKSAFENVLFACRWLLAPFFVLLVVVLLGLLGEAGIRAYQVASRFFALTEEDVILSALGIVDLTLTASLLLLVISSSYANFVSYVDVDAHHGWPRWLVGIDFGELKLRLVSSIVAISAIKLLEAFMNVEHQTDRALAWQLGLFGGFLAAVLVLAISDRIGHGGANSRKKVAN